VHRDRDGQGAARDDVVDDGRDGVDADLAVPGLARGGGNGVSDEVLGAESFFDVREVMIGRFY